jgi:hypothetical protein
MVDVLMLAMFGGALALGVANLLGVEGDRQMLMIFVNWTVFGVIGVIRQYQRRRHA